MNLDYFKEARVVTKNGVATTIQYAELNANQEITLITDLVDTSESGVILLLLDDVAYIKQFDSYFIQYRNKRTGKTLQLPYEEENKDYEKMGTIDVYQKVFPPFQF